MTRINPKSTPPPLAKSLTTMDTSTATPRDPNTVSNYNHWKTKHTVVDLAIDFKKQRLHGTVSLLPETLPTPPPSLGLIKEKKNR